jgi:hypothetical protein
MRWFKVAAIAGGILIAFLVVGSVVHFIFSLITGLVIAAAVAGAIYVAFKVARSGRQISRKREEREVRDRARERESHQPLPRADVEPYSTSVPTQQPRQHIPNTQDIDDELARLKREMDR